MDTPRHTRTSVRTAACHCGGLRLTVTCDPSWTNVCHCKACQRRTGAVIHSGAYFLQTDVTVDGPTKTYARPADSGYAIAFHFCPECGSNVYWEASRFPRYYGVAVGAFADPGFPAPRISVYESRRHSWIRLPAGIRTYDKDPA